MPINIKSFVSRSVCKSIFFRYSRKAHQERLQQVFVTGERFKQWLEQFDREDHSTALELVSQLDLISYPKLLNLLTDLHGKLSAQMIQDRFVLESGTPDWSSVDFSKPYTAKSGDLISYFYRRVSRMPGRQFYDLETLAQVPDKQSRSKRVLVILDDYTGSGAQFLIEVYGRKYAHLLNQYNKVYFAVVVANEKAVRRFQLIENGRIDDAINEMIADFNIKDAAAVEIAASMKRIERDKLQLLTSKVEYPNFKEEPPDTKSDKLRKFLLKYNQFSRNHRAPYGVGGLSGNTVFFYGPPNSLPDVLWNSLGILNGKPLKPLFSRLEDLSIYPDFGNLPPDEVIWGD